MSLNPDCFILFEHLCQQPIQRSGAGWFFKGYVHDCVLQEGDFTAVTTPVSNWDSQPQGSRMGYLFTSIQQESSPTQIRSGCLMAIALAHLLFRAISCHLARINRQWIVYSFMTDILRSSYFKSL